jgi:uncharacterized protein YciI
MGGPFSDRSGGLITFAANNMDEEKELINRDPFIIEDLVSEKWIIEWIVE